MNRQSQRHYKDFLLFINNTATGTVHLLVEVLWLSWLKCLPNKQLILGSNPSSPLVWHGHCSLVFGVVCDLKLGIRPSEGLRHKSYEQRSDITVWPLRSGAPVFLPKLLSESEVALICILMGVTVSKMAYAKTSQLIKCHYFILFFSPCFHMTYLLSVGLYTYSAWKVHCRFEGRSPVIRPCYFRYIEVDKNLIQI